MASETSNSRFLAAFHKKPLADDKRAREYFNAPICKQYESLCFSDSSPDCLAIFQARSSVKVVPFTKVLVAEIRCAR